MEIHSHGKIFRQITYTYCNFISKNVAFTKFLPKESETEREKVNFRNFHTVHVLPRFCSKNSVKLTFLLKNFTLNLFDEKICVAVNFSFFFHSVDN